MCSKCFAHIICLNPTTTLWRCCHCWLQGGIYLSKWFLVVNWAHIYNKSLAAAVYRRPLTQAVFRGKASHWAAKTPALCCSRLSQPLQRSFRNRILTSGLRPVVYNSSCTTISLFACLLTNQNGPIMTSQDTKFPTNQDQCRPIKLCKYFVFLICIKMD